jgi:hypothetical protein
MKTEGRGVEKPVFNPRQQQIILLLQKFNRTISDDLSNSGESYENTSKGRGKF